jgi:hypothetical protein
MTVYGPEPPVWRLSFHGECRRVTGRRAEEKKTTRMTHCRRPSMIDLRKLERYAAGLRSILSICHLQAAPTLTYPTRNATMVWLADLPLNC